MSDKSEYMKEKNRSIFRKRVVSEDAPQTHPTEEIEDLDLAEDEGSTETAAAEDPALLKKQRIRKLLLIGGAFVAAMILFWAVRTWDTYRQYTSIEQVQEIESSSEGNHYEAFAGGMLRYSANGMALLDTSGRAVWDYGYSMKSPVMAVNGSYGIVGDRQAQTAVIFGTDGMLGTITTTMPILGLTISAHGVAALMLDDTDSSVIQFYDRTGLKLDITVKNVLTETTGYPMDLSLSPTGTGLILSMIYMDQGSMQSRITFLNFDVGKSSSDRVVGMFPYGETLFPQVEYLSDTRACAFGDSQIEFYSLQNEASPQLITSVPCDSQVQSVFAGNGKVGVVLNGENGQYQLRVYNSDGVLLMARDIPFAYTHAEFNGSYLAFYNSSECLLLNENGSVKYEGMLDGTVNQLFFINANTFLQFGGQTVREMKLR